MIDGEQPVAE